MTQVHNVHAAAFQTQLLRSNHMLSEISQSATNLYTNITWESWIFKKIYSKGCLPRKERDLPNTLQTITFKASMVEREEKNVGE